MAEDCDALTKSLYVKNTAINTEVQTCSASGSIPPETRLAVEGSKPMQPDKYTV